MPWGNPDGYGNPDAPTGPSPFFPDAQLPAPQPGTVEYNLQNRGSQGGASAPASGSQAPSLFNPAERNFTVRSIFNGTAGTLYNSYSRPTDRNSDTYAQDMRAYLAREEYNDYLRRFAPMEQELINSVMTRDMLNDRLSAVSVNNQVSRKSAETAVQMQNARYGVAQSPAEQARQKAQMDRQAALSMANGMNQTRTHIFDRNMNALAGGSGAIRGTIREGYGG